jgi:predicted dinucleotide-binding enzyme
LWLGWPYITIAGIILVAVPYIKVRKLTAQLADLLEHHESNMSAKNRDERRDLLLDKERASLEKTIRLWDSLTLF